MLLLFQLILIQDIHSFISDTLTSMSTKQFFTSLELVNASLKNHVIRSRTVNSATDCMFLCQSEMKDACKSFNVETRNGITERTCELNLSAAKYNPAHFINRMGYTYYEELD